MHIARIYFEQNLEVNSTIALPQRSAHHVSQVLRLKPGDPVIVFNGKGGEYTGEINTINHGRVTVNTLAYLDVSRESNLQITLGIGILKRDAMNSALQKATELGVVKIVPLEMENCSVPRKQFARRQQQWLQVVEAACEQSGRTRLPVVEPVQDIRQWFTQPGSDLKLLASLTSQNKITGINIETLSVDIVIGPEGGMTENEEMLALASGYTSFTLGERIMRAETAPAAILSLLQYRWGDFG